MITVTIGGMSFPVDKVSEGWVNQMIADAKKRGVPLCIQVSVQTDAARVNLATPGCGGVGGGGGRPPNPTEQRIIDAWMRKGLQQSQFTPGDFRSFLNELARIL